MCGVCGGVVREVQGNSFAIGTPDQKIRQFWTRTKIVALTTLVLVAISSVGTGLYLSARPNPSCTNHALNYPSCSDCGPVAAYTASTNSCSCTNDIITNHPARTDSKALNPPACNQWCANNAINPPSCDQCADNQTDITCPPAYAPPKTQAPENILLAGYSLPLRAET